MITIQNNRRQRNILIFDSAFNLDESNDFPHDMFDAVFILASSADEAKSILNTINPVTSHKCCYKPFLVSKDLKGQLHEYDELIDCYTYDIDDSDALDTVDEIINHITDIGLQPDDHRFLSGNLFFIRLFRYLISRRIYHLTPTLTGMSGMGYTIPLFELFHKQEAYKLSEYIMFNQSLLEKRYVRTISFINRIYLCPQCLHSHLLYIENCPHCHSSAIKSEEVIHHFRCANISPEHTYNFGGQLRCPKCHHLLRHIGVDYDRPSVVYTCSNCENTFLQPRMTSVCTSCGNHTDVSDLTPYDITAFEITQEGREAIVSPNIGFTIYTDFYDNYMEFERFTGRLRMLSELKDTGSMDTGIEIIKVWVLNDKEETCPLSSDFIAMFCKRFSTYRVSSANNMVYLKNTVYDYTDNSPSSTGLTERVDTIISKAASLINPDERICYAVSHPTGTMDEFIDSLRYISPFPDKTLPFSQNGDTQIAELKPAKKEEEVTTVASEDKRSGKSFLKRILITVITLTVLAMCIIYIATKHAAQTSSTPATGQDIVSTVSQKHDTDPTNEQEAERDREQGKYVRPMEPDMFYVVTDVFQNKDNAWAQLRMDSGKHPAYEYHIYHYGKRFVVSPFRSFNRGECQQFISSKEWNGDAWITTGKGNKGKKEVRQ